jgi:hypothetical protein
MKILAAGDSFTFGEELADLNNAWPFLVGQKCNANVVNLAKPACSNDRMVRLMFEFIIDHRNPKPDLVLIGWSSPGRIEFADETGAFDVWPGYAGNLFIKDGCTWRKEIAQYISMYNDPKWLFRRFLQQVIMTQSFLKAQNIKYVMINTMQNEYYKQRIIDDRQDYFKEIDTSCFLGFDKEGMGEWTYDCKLGPNGHFLDEGHRIVAEKVYEHIGNLGWVS